MAQKSFASILEASRSTQGAPSSQSEIQTAPEAAPEVEQQAETTTAASPEQPAEETADTEIDEGEPATAAAPPPEKPKEGKPPPKFVPVTSLTAERKKRQEAERRLLELQGQVQAYSRMTPQAPPAPKEPEDDEAAYWADPKGWVKKQIEHERQAAQQQYLKRSEAAARGRHNDFDEVIPQFFEACKANPVLDQMAMNAPDPWEYAYEAGRTFVATQGLSSIEDLRAKVREEVLAELAAEKGKQAETDKQKQAQAAAAKVTTSNAGARGGGASAAPAYAGPPSFTSMLERKRSRR